MDCRIRLRICSSDMESLITIFSIPLPETLSIGWWIITGIPFDFHSAAASDVCGSLGMTASVSGIPSPSYTRWLLRSLPASSMHTARRTFPFAGGVTLLCVFWASCDAAFPGCEPESDDFFPEREFPVVSLTCFSAVFTV